MKKVKISKKKIILFSILSFFLVLVIAMFIYLAVPFPVEEEALKILNESENVSVNKNVITITSTTEADSAIIFYPGSKVENSAYLPLFEKITLETGLTCFLVDMPLNQAFFDANAALKIIEEHPEINSWYMAGHSLGGAMASDFASNHQELIDGVIVLGSYVYGDFPTEKSLTIYGTLNSSIENGIDYSDNIVVIEGGNHAGFGNYGKQPGDPDGLITPKQQQDITVQAIKDFLIN